MTALEEPDNIHRMTVEDYLRIAELDPAFARTELIEGVVYDVSVRPDKGVLLRCADPGGDQYRDCREVPLPPPEQLEGFHIGPVLED